ncbi:hypothetical protein BDF19DRAFT_435582 [Syncephalis fuscata]|nr:hypothetical protein BDF19DRAFT_435582 [Syncephalis fuscata]
MGGGHRLLGLKKRLSSLRPSPSVTTLSTIDTVSSSTTLSPSVMGNYENGSTNRLSVALSDDQSNPHHTSTIHSMSSQLSGYGSIASLDVDPYASLSGGNSQFRALAPDRHLYRLTCRANEQFHRKRYRAALSEYSKAIRLVVDGNKSSSIYQSSAPLSPHEKLAELTRKGGETADFTALLYANRSASRCMLNDYEEAKADAEIAIRIRPDWGKGFYRKGEALLGLRQYEEALSCYEECLQRDPTNPDARVGVANAQIKLEDQESGLFTLQLLAGRDYAVIKSLRPIQNKIFEFAGVMRNFIYLIADRDTRDCVIVDACWDVPGLLDIIKRENLNLVGSIVTHHHFDHVGGTPPPPFDQFRIRVSGLATVLKKRPTATAYVHPLDVPDLVPANPSLSLARIRPTPDGYVLKLGRRTTIQFLHTPGHTPGSQCLLVNGRRLFTGDTLFLGCCGRLDLPGGSPEAMWRSLRRLASLDDHLVVYPGHEYGGEWSTLQEEKMAGALKDCTFAEWMRQQEERNHSHSNDEEHVYPHEHSINEKETDDINTNTNGINTNIHHHHTSSGGSDQEDEHMRTSVEDFPTNVPSFASSSSLPPPLIRIRRRVTTNSPGEDKRPRATTFHHSSSVAHSHRMDTHESPSSSSVSSSATFTPSSRPMSVPNAHALFNLQWQHPDIGEEEDTDDELPSEDSVIKMAIVTTTITPATPTTPIAPTALHASSSFTPQYSEQHRLSAFSPTSPNRPSSASIKSFGLENDSYPSEEDSDFE